LGTVFGFAPVPYLLAVSALLVSAEVLELLEGENNQLTVRVNEDGGGPANTWREAVGVPGPPRART